MKRESTVTGIFAITIILLLSNSHVFADECLHPNGQPYEDHWQASIETIEVERAKNEAAKETITQWSARALLCESALDQFLANADSPKLVCDIKSDFVDGQGGRVWKPKSDNTNAPVFLLEPQYFDLLPRDEVDRVRVYYEQDGFEVKDKDKFREANGHNGGRYHHDVFLLTEESLLIQLARADGVVECISVPSGTQRYD